MPQWRVPPPFPLSAVVAVLRKNGPLLFPPFSNIVQMKIYCDGCRKVRKRAKCLYIIFRFFWPIGWLGTEDSKHFMSSICSLYPHQAARVTTKTFICKHIAVCSRKPRYNLFQSSKVFLGEVGKIEIALSHFLLLAAT